MPFAERAGLGIHWRTDGAGPRTALLLHCSLAHSGAFRGMMAHLGDVLTATAFDLPGHGKSSDWPGGASYQDATVAVARCFLDEMPGPVDLVGHSFGGTCLLRIAFETPEKVRTLTLIEPPFYDAARAFGDPEIGRQLRRDAAFASWLSAGDREAAARAFVEGWGAGVPWKEITEENRVYFRERIHLVEAAGSTLNADLAGMMAPGGIERVTCPVLLIRGNRSPGAITAVHRALLKRLPDARETVVEGAGHMVPVTHPEPVAAAIRDAVGMAPRRH
jgi:lipase